MNEVAPSLHGQALVGETLTVDEGSWAHSPESFAYEWQACSSSGTDCAALAGQDLPTHVLSASEVGDTVRAMVTAGNVGGRSATLSSASQVVADPVGPPAPPTGKFPEILAQPVVPSRLEWKFARAPKYLAVRYMRVVDPPSGGWVELRCRGHGCPFSRKRLAVSPGGHSLELKALFRGRHLRVPLGVRLVVDIGAPGAIGKTFAFTVRYRRRPALESGCRAPNSMRIGDRC